MAVIQHHNDLLLARADISCQKNENMCQQCIDCKTRTLIQFIDVRIRFCVLGHKNQVHSLASVFVKHFTISQLRLQDREVLEVTKVYSGTKEKRKKMSQ